MNSPLHLGFPKFSRKKEQSLALSSIYFGWFAILIFGGTVFLLGASYALVTFMNVDTVGEGITADSVRKTHYNSKKVEETLNLYRERRQYFDKNMPRSVIVEPPQSEAPVAATTPAGVE